MHGNPSMGGQQMMVGNVQQRMQMQQMNQMNPNMPQRMMRPGVNVQGPGGLRQILQQQPGQQGQPQQFQQQQRMPGGKVVKTRLGFKVLILAKININFI